MFPKDPGRERLMQIDDELKSKDQELRRLFASPHRDDLAIGEVRLAVTNLEIERDMIAGENRAFHKSLHPDEVVYDRRAGVGLGPSRATRNGAGGEEREIRDAFLTYMRTGDEGAARELRAYNDADMIVGTPAEGGYAVPTAMMRTIKARRDESMLAVKLGCELVEGRGTTVNYPIDNESDVIFTAVNEASAIDQDSPDLSSVALTYVKYAKYCTLSWELLRDEDAALESFLNGWLARGWAATHNSLLLTEALANGTSALTLDAAAAIGAAEIPEFVGKLAPEYQEGARWVMNPTTHAYLQGLTGNVFQFAPTPGGTQSQTLWGYPVHQSSYAPALAASAKSLIFGNWQYVAYRDGSLSVLRDPFSAATTGQVRLHAWFSAVYAVTQSEAIIYGTNPTG